MIPLAAGVLAPWGFVMLRALGALATSISTVVVAVNAQLGAPGEIHRLVARRPLAAPRKREPAAPNEHPSDMKSFPVSLDLVQLDMIEAVETAGSRTPDEQRILLADLLAAAFEARQTRMAPAGS